MDGWMIINHRQLVIKNSYRSNMGEIFVNVGEVMV